MTKKEISKILKEISDLLLILGENEFKARAYQNASRVIESIDNIEDIFNGNVKGIGKSISSVVKEIFEKKESSLLNELISKLPEGVIELLKLKGLGAKRIKVLYNELGISSVGELEYACRENRLLILKGFGKKIQDNILKAINEYKKNITLFTIFEAENIVKDIFFNIKKKGIKYFAITGDYRRRKEVYSNLEFICYEKDKKQIEKILRKYNRKIILHFVNNKTEFIKKLFITTGSKEFVDSFKIPEYPKSEKDIFEFNNRNFVIPEQRENFIKSNNDYIRYCDIKGIFHVHTTYSDGSMSIEDIVRYLISKGYKYVGISDHSKSAYYANGLKEDDIKKQHDEIDKLNEKYTPFKIFKGIESDILKDGSLDYSENILEKFDFVIASVHSSFNMSKKQMTERIVKAIQNPFTTIFGHPTGRLLTVREGYEIDMEKIFEVLNEYNKAVEINAQPYRLDLDWKWVYKSKNYNIKFFICPDAHNKEDFDYVKYGVGVARKAGISKNHIINCLELNEIPFLK